LAVTRLLLAEARPQRRSGQLRRLYSRERASDGGASRPRWAVNQHDRRGLVVWAVAGDPGLDPPDLQLPADQLPRWPWQLVRVAARRPCVGGEALSGAEVATSVLPRLVRWLIRVRVDARSGLASRGAGPTRAGYLPQADHPLRRRPSRREVAMACLRDGTRARHPNASPTTSDAGAIPAIPLVEDDRSLCADGISIDDC